MVACAYAVSAFWWAYPYAYIPTDDSFFVNGLGIHKPLFQWFVHKAVLGMDFLSLSKSSSLILVNSLSNALSLFSGMAFVFLLTRKPIWAILFAVLFMGSAWPHTYLFFASYAPMTAALATTSMMLLLKAYQDNFKNRWAIRGAGLFLGLTVSVSISAALYLVLECIAFAFLVFQCPKAKRKQFIYDFTLPLFIVLFYVWDRFGQHFNAQILQGAEKSHQANALSKFGYIPLAPFGSFFYILKLYSSPLLLLAGGSVCAGLWAKKKAQLAFCVLAICLAHALCLDLYSDAIMARLHFIVYPLLLVAILGLLGSCFTRFRWIPSVVLSLLVGVHLLYGFQWNRSTYRVKQWAPKYFQTLEPGTQFYVLESDPHKKHLMAWLADYSFKSVATTFALALDSRDKRVLVMGPHGKDSGLSILEHANIKDFYPNLKGLESSRVESLPYFAFHPPFLLEEEVCFALNFEGKTPNNTLPRLGLSVFHRGARR